MFKAIIRGKSGGLSSEVSIDSSMPFKAGLDVKNVREDLLTAAIFSRLSYLAPEIIWGVLSSTFPSLPRRKVARLINLEYWPNWDHPDDERSFVEPDIFIQMEIGDPGVKVDLIVEAKRFDTWTPQSAAQHAIQIQSYYFDETIERGQELHFLALGGLGSEPTLQIKSLASNFKEGRENFDGASWTSLAVSISAISNKSTGDCKFIFRDLLEILEYAGFKNRTYFEKPITVNNFFISAEPNGIWRRS